MKTRKLRKLFTKLQAVKQDISDVTEEYNRDRRDLVTINSTLLNYLISIFGSYSG
jgi:kinesin family member 3B